MENPFEIIINRIDNLDKLLRYTLAEFAKSQKQPQEDIMNIDEASQLLNLSRNTVYQFVSKASIPHYKKGKKLYFSREEIKKWVLSGRVKTKKEIEDSI